MEGWRADALADHEATLFVDGTMRLSGRGRQIMGNPLTAMTWFVNHMAERRIAIAEGAVVSTGSCTEVYAGRVGERVVADFGSFGTVEAHFV